MACKAKRFTATYLSHLLEPNHDLEDGVRAMRLVSRGGGEGRCHPPFGCRQATVLRNMEFWMDPSPQLNGHVDRRYRGRMPEVLWFIPLPMHRAYTSRTLDNYMPLSAPRISSPFVLGSIPIPILIPRPEVALTRKIPEHAFRHDRDHGSLSMA